jgi:hypothetical protein
LPSSSTAGETVSPVALFAIDTRLLAMAEPEEVLTVPDSVVCAGNGVARN